MKVHHGFEEWKSVGRTVASLGNFDGVHLGHQLILKNLLLLGREFQAPTVVVTFDPVPKKVLIPAQAPPLIQTLDQRLRSLAALNIDHTIVVVFNSDFASKSPEEFVRGYLVNLLHVKRFVVGQNFAFGHQKSGDVSLLQKMGARYDFEVLDVPIAHQHDTRVSSTLIRSLVADGKVREALEMLGHPFALVGEIVRGDQLGGKLGIPTANLRAENELLPGKGVYVTVASIGEHAHRSVTNVGVRPTVGGDKMTIEAHLLDSSAELYGERMELQFLEKLRDEKKFPNVDELKTQIRADIHAAEDYFKRT